MSLFIDKMREKMEEIITMQEMLSECIGKRLVTPNPPSYMITETGRKTLSHYDMDGMYSLAENYLDRIFCAPDRKIDQDLFLEGFQKTIEEKAGKKTQHGIYEMINNISNSLLMSWEGSAFFVFTGVLRQMHAKGLVEHINGECSLTPDGKKSGYKEKFSYR